MPSLEEHPNSSTFEPKADTSQQNVQQEEESRELTQTDRINQRLLKSFLDRMNNGNVLTPNSNSEKSDSDSGSFDDPN